MASLDDIPEPRSMHEAADAMIAKAERIGDDEMLKQGSRLKQIAYERDVELHDLQEKQHVSAMVEGLEADLSAVDVWGLVLLLVCVIAAIVLLSWPY